MRTHQSILTQINKQMGEKGELLLTVELRLVNVEEMMDTDNQHSVNTTEIIISGRKHQGTSK